jgi:hypothetical protein
VAVSTDVFDGVIGGQDRVRQEAVVDECRFVTIADFGIGRRGDGERGRWGEREIGSPRIETGISVCVASWQRGGATKG